MERGGKRRQRKRLKRRRRGRKKRRRGAIEREEQEGEKEGKEGRRGGPMFGFLPSWTVGEEGTESEPASERQPVSGVPREARPPAKCNGNLGTRFLLQSDVNKLGEDVFGETRLTHFSPSIDSRGQIWPAGSVLCQ